MYKADPAPEVRSDFPPEVITEAAQRLRRAIEAAEMARQTVKAAPWQAIYRRDLERAEADLEHAKALLSAVIDRAEDAADEAWVRMWLDRSRAKLRAIESAAYTGALRVKGFFG